MLKNLTQTMPYYCFLCNEYHCDSPTEEHFIPRSIHGPEYQWLYVCDSKNTRSNTVFDKYARNIFYWARFQDTATLKRSGEALLCDGTLKSFKFAYDESSSFEKRTAFCYIYDRETDTRIPSSSVYAISTPVGLMPNERETFCRGLVKISIGTLVYLLKNKDVENETIKNIFMQESVEALRYFALNEQWLKGASQIKISLGRDDVLNKLQQSCANQGVCNHVITMNIQNDSSIQIEGMLYSQYGWVLNISNNISLDVNELRLENQISDMAAPHSLRDVSQSPDFICIINPDYTGQKPQIPLHWS